MFPAKPDTVLPKGKLLHFVLALLFTLAVAWMQYAGHFELRRWQAELDDSLAGKGRKSEPSSDLVYVAFDEASRQLDPELDVADFLAQPGAGPVEKRALELMAGRQWPWSREIYAVLLDRLFDAGAKAVILDFTYPAPGEGDAIFRAALERHRGRVAIAANMDAAVAGTGGTRRFVPPALTVVPPEARDGTLLGYPTFSTGADGTVRFAHFRDVIHNNAGYADETHGAESYRSLAAAGLAAAGLGAQVPEDFHPRRMRLAGAAGAFKPHSVHELFVPEMWRRNFQNGEFFKGKIVLCGPHGNWSQDNHRTALGMLPGPEIHLNAMNNVIQSEFIGELPPVGAALLVVLAGVLSWALWRLVQRPFLRLAILGGGLLLWWEVVNLLFGQSLLLPSLAPALVFTFVGATGLLSDFVTEKLEKQHVRRTLERYVSKNVVGELLERRDEYAAGVVKPVTVLFSDVRNFTRVSAETDPRALVAQLNEYFAAMVECVFRHNGTVDKFMGDAVMAVWGNALSRGISEDACDAIRCARGMRSELAKLNERWQREGRPLFDIGIALNHGVAVAGDLGSPNKMEFTVIGDSVNVAWRLQERTKEHPGEILVGESLAALIAGTFETESLGQFRVGGTIEVSYARVTGIV